MIFKDETGLTGCVLTCYCFPLEATTLLCDLLFSRTHDLPRVHQCLPQILKLKLHSDINTPCLAYRYVDDTYILSFLPVLWIFVVKGIPSKIRSVSKNNEIAFKKANFWIFCSMFSLPLAEYMVSLFVGKNPQKSMDFSLVSLMIL